MEVIIHGTSGGAANTFFKTKANLSEITKDLRGNSEASVGQSAYSIEFIKNSCIFTRYIIIRDTVRSSSVGYIAFSVFNPYTETMSGANIKSMLDEIAEGYYSRNVTDNNFDARKNDCNFVQAIIDDYEKKDTTDKSDEAVDIKTGVKDKDAAFLYYSTENELENYFNNPYQEKYNEYKLVFFVDKSFETSTENPLGALTHDPSSDLTGKIDLNDSKYTLHFDNDTEVIVNGKTRKNNGKVPSDCKYEIHYTKKDHKEKILYSESADFERYVNVDKERKTVTIKKPDLEPNKRTIEISVIDRDTHNSIPINNFIVVAQDENKIRSIDIKNNSIEFIGEDINKEVAIIIVSNVYNDSQIKKFIPANEKALEFDIDKKIEKNPEVKASRTDTDKIEGNNIFNPPNLNSQPTKSLKDKMIDFVKKHHNIFLVISVILFLIICSIIYYLFFVQGNNTKNTESYLVSCKDEDKISSMVEEASNLDSLKNIHGHCCGNKEKSLIQDIKGIFGNEYVQPEYCSKIDNAIDIREAINSGNIERLKNIETHFSSQINLKKSINNINEECTKQISDSLSSISKNKEMSFNEVIELIERVQNIKKPEVSAPTKTTPSEKSKSSAKDNSAKKPNTVDKDMDILEKFLKLVKNRDLKKTDFDALYDSKNGSKDFNKFYDNYLNTSGKFDKLKKIEQIKRQRVESYSDLEKILKEG